MTRVSEIMSSPACSIGPQESLRRAASLMRELDVGSLPVCHDERLLGMVTDRDIVTRGVATGLAPDGGCVSDVMTAQVSCCTPDQDVQEVMQQMSDEQLRRLPVVDSADRLVGIVALADVALTADREAEGDQVGETVRRISEPANGAATA